MTDFKYVVLKIAKLINELITDTLYVVIWMTIPVSGFVRLINSLIITVYLNSVYPYSVFARNRLKIFTLNVLSSANLLFYQ